MLLHPVSGCQPKAQEQMGRNVPGCSTCLLAKRLRELLGLKRLIVAFDSLGSITVGLGVTDAEKATGISGVVR